MVQQTPTLPEHVTWSQYRFSQEFRVIIIVVVVVVVLI